jgi:hypothetical protein
MAIVAGIKIKTKSTKAMVIRERAAKDYSPSWADADSLSAIQFMRKWHSIMEWYRLESSAKQLKPQVINWMARHDYTKNQITAFKKTKDNRCNLTMGSIAACLNKGMPERSDFNHGRSTAEWLRKAISVVVEDGRNDVEEGSEEKPVVLGLSIQERVRQASFKMTEEIETALEQFAADAESFDPKAFKVLSLLKGKEAKAAHSRVIKQLYQRQLEELVEAATTKDAQLKEAYAYLSKANLKKITLFYQEIASACDMLGQEAKVNRKPRVKKSVPKDQLISKLKYAKTNEPLKVVSINPVDIIGSKELWVYNIKSRKLGKYVADEYKDLSIKGTTIVGFNATLSVQKTLRKPQEQLKEFKSAGKVQLRKFLDDIKAVDIMLNGRINEDIILLKVQ